MRSLQLQAALSEFVEAAASHLHAEVATGAEVGFELEQQRGRRRTGAPTLYCYQPLTGEFIAERETALERLPSYAEAARLLGAFDGLDRYLASVGKDLGPRAGRAVRVSAAIGALLCEVFAEQTDFELRPERLHSALERLECSTLAGSSDVTLVATLHGLTVTSSELALTKGLTIAQPHALEGLPAGAVSGGEDDANHLVVVLACEQSEPREALARGREVLKDLLRALRLFGDGRVTLGSLAWARVGGGAWSPLVLGAGGRPRGMLIVAAEQEDELRAFCNLVSRRAPHGNELAWALRRFELGCERDSAYEALSDHLLALRALLGGPQEGEPDASGSSLLARRLAALCATAEGRAELTERSLQALALERAVIDGSAVEHAGAETLAKDIADHLRALLRDVICGHLEPDLVTLADELLVEPEPEPSPEPVFESLSAQPASAAVVSGEKVFGDLGQDQEILDIFI
jgi:hypothetical protein